jgi:hypothetical protein
MTNITKQAAGTIIGNWRIGQTSARYESGGRGVSTISSGAGDAGGISYGVYQLSSKMGTLAEYLNDSKYGNYSQYFTGLPINSQEFKDKWRELAASDLNFGITQHEFIKDTHFQSIVNSIASNGIDLSNRGLAVQEMIWSNGVQHRGNTAGIYKRALETTYGKNYDLDSLTDSQIIEAIYDYRLKNVNGLFASSDEKTRNAVTNRIPSEKEDVLRLAGLEEYITSNQDENYSGKLPSTATSIASLKTNTDTTHPWGKEISFTATEDGPKGEYERGDQINATFDKSGNLLSTNVYRQDGSQSQFAYTDGDRTNAFYTEWTKDPVTGQFVKTTQIEFVVGVDGTKTPVGDFLYQGKTYTAAGAGVGYPDTIDPTTIVPDAAAPTEQKATETAQQQLSNTNYGLGEADLTGIPDSALDFLPSNAADPQALIADWQAKGFTVEQTENALFAQKGDEWFILSDGVIEMGKGDKSVRIDLQDNKLVVFETQQSEGVAHELSTFIDKQTRQVTETTDVQTFDDNSRLETTTLANGTTTTRAFDTDRQPAGSIVDTPDGDGGFDRVITTRVNGKDVVIKQHASEEELYNNSNNNGGGDTAAPVISDTTHPSYIAQFDANAGNYTSYEVRIGGQLAVNNDLICRAIDEQYGQAAVYAPAGALDEIYIGSAGLGIIEAANGGSLGAAIDTTGGNASSNTIIYDNPAEGPLTGLINAGDASVGNGFNDADANFAGGIITHAKSLINAIKSGQPLPIATSVFSLAGHLSRSIAVDSNGTPLTRDGNTYLDAGNVELDNINSGFGIVNGIIGLRQALKNGDNFGALVNAGGIAQNGLKLYQSYLNSELATLAAGSAARDALVADIKVIDGYASTLGSTLVVLNILYSIYKGDYVGAAVAIAAYFVPVIGWAYAAYQIFNAVLGNDPEPKGAAHLVSNSDGRMVHAVLDWQEDGGGAAATGMLNNLTSVLDNALTDHGYHNAANGSNGFKAGQHLTAGFKDIKPTLIKAPSDASQAVKDASVMREVEALEAYTYQWSRDGVAIADATGARYTVTAADEGHKISVKARPLSTAQISALTKQGAHDVADAILATVQALNQRITALNQDPESPQYIPLAPGIAFEALLEQIQPVLQKQSATAFKTALNAIWTIALGELYADTTTQPSAYRAWYDDLKTSVDFDALEAAVTAAFEQASSKLTQSIPLQVSHTNAQTGAVTQSLATQELIHVRDDEGNHLENMGWIADRLPTLTFNQGIYTLTITDANTGKQYTRTYDSKGKLSFGGLAGFDTNTTNTSAGDIAHLGDYHEDIQQAFLNAALLNGAAAARWEVQTIDAQHKQGYDQTYQIRPASDYEGQNGSGYHHPAVMGTRFVATNALAGKTTLARAKAQGQLQATNLGDANPDSAGHVLADDTHNPQQTFAPIVLDLDGSGAIEIMRKATGDGVMIDGDDDGFAEESDWIGTRDGILVLDRNADGKISGGHEMFSDVMVNMKLRGLHALDEIDANGDGMITAADAVYSHLQVWRDINHDGIVRDWELSSLDELKISELNTNTSASKTINPSNDPCYSLTA